MTEERLRDDICEALMRTARAGDNKAYAELFCQITPAIRRFVFARLGDRVDSEDLVQEMLLAVHRASHTYNTDRPFIPWLFSIADHKLKDYLRSQYRKAAFVHVDVEGLAETLREDVTDATLASELLHEMLKKLPERQQRIVRMLKIEGYSVEDIAKEMDMNTSAVKVAAHRAYNVLKRAHGKGNG
jgi:RNA polymerase sigma-70 factor (ECF subfamily)